MTQTKAKQQIDALLFIPNTRWKGKRPWLLLPYSALILTALLNKTVEFEILDANILNLSETEAVNSLKKINPQIIMVSAMSTEYHQQYHQALAIAKKACPSCVTVMGGVYATVMGEHALKDHHLDYIFQGHAEERINDFIGHILVGQTDVIQQFPGVGYRSDNQGIVINPLSTYIADVSHQVQVDYSKIDINEYLKQNADHYQFNSKSGRGATIITSYGCPYNCVFCATRTISGRKIAFRPIKDILDEIDFLVNEHKVNHITFIDDNLTVDRKRIETLLNAFIEKEYTFSWKVASVAAWTLDEPLLKLMKKTGCHQLTISVESGNPRVLKKIIKKVLKLDMVPGIIETCKQIGIDIAGNFVIGLPGETWDEIRDTFRFAEESDFDFVNFHIATPLPKTDLYRICCEQKLLPEDFSFFDERFFGYGQGFISTEEFTPFELSVLRAFEWDRINFKNLEKTKKIAQMMGMDIETLKEHRKKTRINCGIHF
jgi:anaerobic magnesium-protoporphyrin IX monomethyl ester cyclase